MEAFLSLLNEEVLFQFLLLLARILAFVAFMPVFGHAAISPTIRITFAFYITIFVFPLVTVVNTINQDNCQIKALIFVKNETYTEHSPYLCMERTINQVIII